MTGATFPGGLQAAPRSRWLRAGGCVVSGAAIALSAWAAHGVDDPAARAGLQSAAWIALANGVGLAALAGFASSRLWAAALSAIALGTLLFAGALVVGHLAGQRAALAPTGGLLMIGGWLVAAIAALRSR